MLLQMSKVPRPDLQYTGLRSRGHKLCRTCNRIGRNMEHAVNQTMSTVASKHHLRITPQTKDWLSLNLSELWEHRELIAFLAWREVSSRYKQAVLGATWALIQPVLTMVVFSFIFGRLAKVPSDGLPYPIFSFAALLPWQYYQTATQTASNCLVANTNLITKVYFPRLIIPIAAVLPALLDLAIAFSIVFFIMLYFGIYPTWKLAWLPIFGCLAFIIALGCGLWYSALCVQYRDVRHVVPFVMQLTMFASPIAYSSSLIPERYKFLYFMNPLVVVIDGFRWSLLGVGQPFRGEAVGSLLVAMLILLSGLYYFRAVERGFADVI